MSLARKLNLKAGAAMRLLHAPALDLDDVAVDDRGEAVMVFVSALAHVDRRVGPAVEVALRDGIAWIPYPKAGQLGTDLNRDILWKHMVKHGVKPVRQVALDDVWSALRFRAA